MAKPSKHQKGAQQHAEGQHGEKTHQRFIEQLHSHERGEEDVSQQASGAPVEGRHRLFEDREQHDEADKNSEKNRLGRELEREGDEAAIEAHPALKGGFGRNRRS